MDAFCCIFFSNRGRFSIDLIKVRGHFTPALHDHLGLGLACLNNSNMTNENSPHHPKHISCCLSLTFHLKNRFSHRTIPTDCNEAHLRTPRYGRYLTHAHNISPGQWQPWTAVSPLLGLISMA